jgi:hypothetical protein
VTARRETPLTHFMRSGRGGDPQAGTDRKSSVSFNPLSSRWQADADGSGAGGGELFKTALSRPKSSSPDNPQLIFLESRSAVPVKLPTPRYVTFRFKDSNKTTKNISPFYIHKALDSIAGKVSNASRMKNGTLVVEARNETQADVHLKATPSWIRSRAREKTRC